MLWQGVRQNLNLEKLWVELFLVFFFIMLSTKWARKKKKALFKTHAAPLNEKIWKPSTFRLADHHSRPASDCLSRRCLIPFSTQPLRVRYCAFDSSWQFNFSPPSGWHYSISGLYNLRTVICDACLFSWTSSAPPGHLHQSSHHYLILI